jgi:hypothetical protein
VEIMKLHPYLTRGFAVALLLALADIGFAQEEEPASDELMPAAAPASDETSESASAPAAVPAATDELAINQARLADRYKRLEEILSQLAELSAASDPNRARILRQAIAQSREQDINVRFESIVKLLEDERLSAATNNQSELGKELDGLLELLLKADRDKELDSQRDRVREYLKEVARLIRMQRGVRARTKGGDNLKGLSDDQQRVCDATGKLGGTIKEKEAKDEKGKEGTKDSDAKDGDKNDGDTEGDEQKDGDQKDGDQKGSDQKDSDQKSGDGKSPKPSEPSKPSEGQPSEGQPSDGKPSESKPSPGQGSQQSQDGQGSREQQPNQPQDPADRAAERLRKAQQQMEEARKKLDEAEREGASERQKEALAELQQAKAELERILRQLREEEMERLLTQLAARFRKMLELQNAVYEGTVRLDKVVPANRNHDHEIEAARLSRQETLIAHEANKALLLLQEEGSSVAFPEVIEQMHGDMLTVAERLAAVKVDRITQGLEEDIIAALEETIAALEKASKELEKKRTPPGQQPPAGAQPEPPLVNKLQELKMIRSLQMRINNRTQRYGQMIEGEQAETPELISALQDLAERQQRVFKATSDLSQGRND